MSMSAQIFTALRNLVADRVYPDVGPDAPIVPYMTYQRVGGDPINYLDNSQPGKGNARMQISVWAATHTEAELLIQQAETALRAAANLSATVSAGPMSTSDPVTKYRGMIQFFSCWADIPA